MNGWVARDKDGTWFFTNKPMWDSETNTWFPMGGRHSRVDEITVLEEGESIQAEVKLSVVWFDKSYEVQS